MGLGEAVERLNTINIKIWKMEEAIEVARLTHQYKDIGKLTVKIRLLNKDRYAWREYIDLHFGDQARRSDGVKLHHASQ